MPDKKTNANTNEEYDAFNHCNASSSTDCTGLIPTPPMTEEEMESYMDIFDYQPPNVTKRSDESPEENPKP